MYTPILKNHDNGCPGNRAFFHVHLSLSLGTKAFGISGVPINDLAPMKNCLGGCKEGQIRSRCTMHRLALCMQILSSHAQIFSAVLLVRIFLC